MEQSPGSQYIIQRSDDAWGVLHKRGRHRCGCCCKDVDGEQGGWLLTLHVCRDTRCPPGWSRAQQKRQLSPAQPGYQSGARIADFPWRGSGNERLGRRGHTLQIRRHLGVPAFWQKKKPRLVGHFAWVMTNQTIKNKVYIMAPLQKASRDVQCSTLRSTSGQGRGQDRDTVSCWPPRTLHEWDSVRNATTNTLAHTITIHHMTPAESAP